MNMMRVGCLSLLLASCASNPWSDDNKIQPDQVLRIARTMQAEGNVPLAITFYTRAAELDPEAVAPRLELARLLVAQQQWPEALAVYASAAAIAEDDASVQGEYGRLLLQRGQASQALEPLQRAVESAADDAARLRHLNALGVAQSLSDDHEAALASLRRAHTLAPHDAGTRTNLARAQNRAGLLEDTVLLLQGDSSNPLTTPAERVALAEALARLGQPAAARQLLVEQMSADELQTRLASWQAMPASPQQVLVTTPAMPVDAKIAAAPTSVAKPMAKPSAKTAKPPLARNVLRTRAQSADPAAPSPRVLELFGSASAAKARTLSAVEEPPTPKSGPNQLLLGRYATPGLANAAAERARAILGKRATLLQVPTPSGNDTVVFLLLASPATGETRDGLCGRLAKSNSTEFACP